MQALRAVEVFAGVSVLPVNEHETGEGDSGAGSGDNSSPSIETSHVNENSPNFQFSFV